MGFQFDLPTLAAPVPDRPRCGLCKLFKTCESPKMLPNLGSGKLSAAA